MHYSGIGQKKVACPKMVFPFPMVIDPTAIQHQANFVSIFMQMRRIGPLPVKQTEITAAQPPSDSPAKLFKLYVRQIASRRRFSGLPGSYVRF